MPKRTFIDIIMTALSVILMGGTILFPVDFVHQILGIVLFALWILHTILNRRWYASLGKGRYPPFRVLQLVVNSGLAVCAVLLMASGLLMAWFMPVSFGLGFARTAHLIFSHWYYLFMSAHIGLHTNMIFARVKGRLSVVLRVILLLISAYGVYAFAVRGIGNYLLLRQQFFFLDLERGYLLFVVDYLAILVLFATIMHVVSWLLLRRKRK